MMKRRRLGIYCLEGSWYSHLGSLISIEPALRLVSEGYEEYKANYIHRRVETPEELWFYLKKWCQAQYASYPILYLAFHGKKSVILLERKKVKVEAIVEQVRDCCHRGIILFGSCDTMGNNNGNLKEILQGTSLLGMLGYTAGLNWLNSTAFDMLLLERLTHLRRLTRAGLLRALVNARQEFGGSPFYSNLGFRWVLQ